jgi:hypothetical protein
MKCACGLNKEMNTYVVLTFTDIMHIETHDHTQKAPKQYKCNYRHHLLRLYYSTFSES